MNEVTAEVVEVPISVSGIKPIANLDLSAKFVDASRYVHVEYEGTYTCAVCGFQPPLFGSNPAMVAHLKDVHGVAPPDGKWWWFDRYVNHHILRALDHWQQHIASPASTAAPEPDWVAELCKMGYVPRFYRLETKAERYGCVAYDGDFLKEHGEGETPALAAKDVVLKLRAGGAT